MIDDARRELAESGVVEAVAKRNDAAIFDWLIRAFSYQGISDAAASAYMDEHGDITHDDIAARLAHNPGCPKLRGYHLFHGCGYRKWSDTCNEPTQKHRCPLPTHDLRNGRLNQSAYSLFLFMRDLAMGDFVGWVDYQLARPSHTSFAGIPAVLASPVIGPMTFIYGVSWKVLNMALATLLLAADEDRPAWRAAGASMIAIDSLVHNWLVRTGILRSLGAQHDYGPACYQANGCATIVDRLSRLVDARLYNDSYPEYFPRFVQFAIWQFCSQSGFGICNGIALDDNKRCTRKTCDLYHICGRRRLYTQRRRLTADRHP